MVYGGRARCASRPRRRPRRGDPRALKDQLGIEPSSERRAVRAGRFGGLQPDAAPGQPARRAGTCSASSTRVSICAPTARTSSAGSCCTGGSRTRSRSTPFAGSSSRRTTRCALCRDAGLPSAEPYGFVELTPEREYLLVTEFFDGAVELGDAEVGRRGHRRRPADHPPDVGRRARPPRHQTRQPAGPRRRHPADRRGVRGGAPHTVAQAVDLANMMLCLALRGAPESVYQRACSTSPSTEISEAFAAARGIALPSQLRHAIQASGRDLHEEFLQLLPHRPAPSRFSAGARAGWPPQPPSSRRHSCWSSPWRMS